MSQSTEWLSRWQRSQTGFHQRTVDLHLQAHWTTLNTQPGTRVLVPMCGKSLDLKWLSEAGCIVVGIDISLTAIEMLLLESGILARRRIVGRTQIFAAAHITAVSGDFFDIGTFGLGSFPVVYDRAAFGAMAPEYRDAYVKALLEVTVRGSRILMTLVRYPQHETPGPPFSIEAQELQQRLGRWFSIRMLSQVDILASDPRMRARGVTRLHEACCLLERIH